MIIVPGLGLGGTERFILRLALSAKQRHDVHVVSLATDGSLEKEFRTHGVKLSIIPSAKHLRVVQTFLSLRKAIRDFEPDVVQTFLYKADLIGGLAAKSAGVGRIVWSLRHSVLTEGPRRIQYRAIARIAGMLSHLVPDAIVAVSTDAKTSHANMGYRPTNIHVIPNSLEDWAIASAGSLSTCSTDSLQIGIAARYCYEKGHDILLAAINPIYQELGDFTLNFCGSGTEPDGPLAAFICENFPHLLDHCVFRGPLHSIEYQAWFSEINLFMLTSRTEGFPNALAEAATLGLPCIATEVGAAFEILSPLGVTASPSPQELQSALFLHLANQADDHERRLARASVLAVSYSSNSMLLAYETCWRGNARQQLA